MRIKSILTVIASVLLILMVSPMMVFADDKGDLSKIDKDENGKITVFKLINDSEDKQVPVEHSEFTLWRVEGLDVTNPNDEVNINRLQRFIDDNKWDSQEVDGKLDKYNLKKVSSQVTNSSGEVSWGDLEIGVYYVEETKNPLNLYLYTSPFLVSLPEYEDDEWNYDLKVYPLSKPIMFNKYVEELDSSGINSVMEYSFSIEIPMDKVNKLDNFVLTDDLDDRLTYVKDSLVAEIKKSNIVLEEEHYTLTYGEFNGEDNVLRFSLTPEGLSILDQAKKGAVIDIKFEVIVDGVGSNGVIDNSAVLNVNMAEVEEEDSTDDDEEVEPEEILPEQEILSNTVESTWGLIEIFSHYNNDPLEGTEFQVFSSKDKAKECVSILISEVAEDSKKECSNGIASPTGGESIYTTDEDGLALVPGLSIGVKSIDKDNNDIDTSQAREYYIVETKVPEGFTLTPENMIQKVVLKPSGDRNISVNKVSFSNILNDQLDTDVEEKSIINTSTIAITVVSITIIILGIRQLLSMRR